MRTDYEVLLKYIEHLENIIIINSYRMLRGYHVTRDSLYTDFIVQFIEKEEL